MTETRLPKVFADLAGTLKKQKAGTLDRAALLTELLLAVPDLQAHLGELRRDDVNQLHDNGMPYKDMAPTLKVKPERVSAIARKAPSGKDIRRKQES